MKGANTEVAIDYGKVFWLVSCAVVSLLAAYHCQPYLANNSNALNAILTVFSVLAGFLIAVIAIVADERILRGSTVRHDEIKLRALRRRLLNHRAIFRLFLFVLGAAVALLLLPQEFHPASKLWLERIVAGSATLGFLLSFSLPSQLMREHVSMLEKAISARRTDD